MSRDKWDILNPPDLQEIDSFSLFGNSKIIRERVMKFYSAFLRSKKVLTQFELLLGECYRFHERIASDLLNMENEWMDRRIKKMSYDRFDVQFECRRVEISQLSILLRLVFSNFGDFSTIKEQSINEIYNRWRDESRRVIQNHLKSNIGLVFHATISRVTNTILPRSIKSIEKTIQHISKNRQKLLDNQKSLSFLVTKVTRYKSDAEDLHNTFVEKGLLTEHGMC